MPTTNSKKWSRTPLTVIKHSITRGKINTKTLFFCWHAAALSHTGMDSFQIIKVNAPIKSQYFCFAICIVIGSQPKISTAAMTQANFHRQNSFTKLLLNIYFRLQLLDSEKYFAAITTWSYGCWRTYITAGVRFYRLLNNVQAIKHEATAFFWANLRALQGETIKCRPVQDVTYVGHTESVIKV